MDNRKGNSLFPKVFTSDVSLDLQGYFFQYQIKDKSEWSKMSPLILSNTSILFDFDMEIILERIFLWGETNLHS